MSYLPVLLLGLPGHTEWIVVLILALIFFGNRIPGMARALGSGINEFKSGLREGDKDKGETPKLEGDKDGKDGKDS